MGGTRFRQTSRVTRIPKPVSEARGREGLAARSRQEGQVIGRMLHYPDLAIADVLAVHVDNVTAALTGVQQEAEGKMLASTDRPTRLEDTDLLYRPSMKAILI